jgi:hypothetical protein
LVPHAAVDVGHHIDHAPVGRTLLVRAELHEHLPTFPLEPAPRSVRDESQQDV